MSESRQLKLRYDYQLTNNDRNTLFFIYFNKIVSYNSCGTVNWLRNYNEVRNSVHNKKGISLYINNSF